MVTEVIIEEAVKAVLGFGFEKIIKKIFSSSNELSNREVVQLLTQEIRQQNGGITTDLAERLERLQVAIEALAATPRALLPASQMSQTGVFCEFCGVVPGGARDCLPRRKNKYKTHSWKPLRNGVYCQYCGAVPGSGARVVCGKGQTGIKLILGHK
jgi:hypothetical protein